MIIKFKIVLINSLGNSKVEDISDEYEMAGVNLRCRDCPLFQPVRKMDGTIDKRAKWGGCEFSPFGYGQTTKDSRACNTLFEMINSGEVKLCLNSED